MVLLLGDMRVHGSTTEKSLTANLNHVCLDNQLLYSLDVTEFRSELWDSQSLFADTTEMIEKYRKLNHTCCAIVCDFSYKTVFFLFFSRCKLQK